MVQSLLKPVDVPSLKDEVVQQIESLILSGSVEPGERLPAERELAQALKVSRPVVHEGILQLEKKGLVTIRPRHGVVVNDYRIHGSTELLASLWHFNDGELAPEITASMIELRVAVEQQAAARLAEHCDTTTLAELENLLADSEQTDAADAATQAELDFQFHFVIALQSGNLVFPMLMNSFKEVYLALLTRFFADRSVFAAVCSNRRDLLAALSAGDSEAAREVMTRTSHVGSYRWHGSWSKADPNRDDHHA